MPAISAADVEKLSLVVALSGSFASRELAGIVGT